MKKLIKNFLSFIVKINWIWNLLDKKLFRIVRYLEKERNKLQKKEESLKLKSIIETISPNYTVLSGPFKGMKFLYHELEESTLFPKIIGSYESEIVSIIENICSMGFSKVLNVGSGEPYYAVGLAMRLPSSLVYAFDTNSEACFLCEKIAKMNAVESRVIINNSSLNTDTLANFCSSQSGFIIPLC